MRRRYLTADGEEGTAGGIHENDLAFTEFHVVIHSENQITFAVEHRETVTVKKEGFLPYCQYGAVSVKRGSGGGGGGEIVVARLGNDAVWINFSHSDILELLPAKGQLGYGCG